MTASISNIRRGVVSFIEQALPWAMLALLQLATYALFVLVPYRGFYLEGNGQIGTVYVPGSPLQRGDVIWQVNDLAWEDYKLDLRIELLQGAQTGETVHMLIERNGQPMEFDYVIPAPTAAEIRQRILNIWVLPYAFWVVGTLALLLARPKDTLWRLLIAFNYLTALWLQAGILSGFRMFDGAVWLRVLIWLSVPVYLQFHFIFPSPLWRWPKAVWWAAYGVAALMIVAQLFRWLPPGLYFSGFLLAVVGSLVLLVLHYLFHPADRKTIAFVTRIALLAILPVIGFAIYGGLTGFNSVTAGGLLFLPILPGAYAYAIYRHKLGGLELRVNRGIALYAYLTLIVSLAFLFFPLAGTIASDPTEWIVVGNVGLIAAVLITLFGFNRFQQFVDTRILKIQYPPARLLKSYAAQITATTHITQLIGYLQNKVAPSLLIRQSALMKVEDGRLRPLYNDGIDLDSLPQAAAELAAQAGPYLPPEAASPAAPPTWVRLILPLTIESQVLAFWLLGRRDPDDYYSAADVDTLTTLANQTAVALHNIVQAEQLHTLYQNDVDQREQERADVAREIHDQVLSELGHLRRRLQEGDDKALLDADFQRLADMLRGTITGLRPAAVDYGLRLALHDLVDRVNNSGSTARAVLTLDDGDDPHQRHPANVELHVYRIIQEAVNNAAQSARAFRIAVYGKLRPALIDLNIDDDGQGFELSGTLNMAQVAAGRHFGLANMLERANLIGARVEVKSMPGRGTQIRVVWPAEAGRAASG